MGHIHRARPQDCIASIAFEHGFRGETIWQHPENEALRQARKNPNVLREGDAVFIPDLRQKHVEIATTRRHRFRRIGVPEVLRVRFRDSDGLALSDQPYTFTPQGGSPRTGTTDADGAIREWIEPGALGAEIVLGTGADQRKYRLQLGRLAPITDPAGIRARLFNLGYGCKPAGGAQGADLVKALRRLQKDEGLAVTGVPNDATRAALLRRHGV